MKCQKILRVVVGGFALLTTQFLDQAFAAAPAFLSQYMVGSIAGEFGVNQGAATYSIPISIPPGVAGMEPELALGYSSHAGDSGVGMGWALNGLSAITRCGRNLDQDGSVVGIEWKNTDRYCLDGIRLVLVSGTYGADGSEYRTEIDGVARIRAHGEAGQGPASFSIQTKSGQTFYYGSTPDSQVEAHSRTDIYAWVISRAEDAVGNEINYAYHEHSDHTEFYPLSVSYSENRIDFEYEVLPDSETDATYISGVKFRRTAQLKRVVSRTEVNSNAPRMVSELKLTFNKRDDKKADLLTKIEQCVPSGCLPPTEFVWDIPADIRELYGSSKNWLSSGYPTETVTDADANTFNSPVAFRVIDVNADGLDDGYGVSRYSAFGPPKSAIHVYLSSGTRFSRIYSSPSCTECSFAMGDVNGDGLADIVRASKSAVDVSLRTSNGFTSFGRWRTVTFPTQAYFDPNAGSNQQGAWKTTAAPFEVVDVDGDARGDLSIVRESRMLSGYSRSLIVYRSTGSGFTNFYSTSPCENCQWGMGDVTGDGYGDLLKAEGNDLKVWNGFGNGTFGSSRDWEGPFPSTLMYDTDSNSSIRVPLPFRTQDLNGDGKRDIVSSVRNNVLNVDKINSYQVFPQSRSIGVRFCPDCLGTGDFNGDGLIDKVTRSTSPLSQEITVAFGLNRPNEKITAIRNGFGSEISVSYEELADSSVHTLADPQDYPLRTVRGTLPLVKTVAKDNGLGGFLTTSYRYGGAIAHARGRGFLGFEWDTVTDEATGVTTRTEYSQEFPYVGMPLSVSTFTTDGTVISSSESTYTELYDVLTETRPNGSTYDYETHFPYLVRRVERSFDLDGTLVSTVETEQSGYDAYGNVGEVIVTTTAGGESFKKTTTNTYDNVVTEQHWHLGRLRSASVLHEHPNGTSETRKSAFEYDAVSGLLSKEIIEPDSPEFRHTTSYEYDQFGNKIKVTVSADGLASRTTTTHFDPTGRFATKVVNALNHEENRKFDTATGKALELTGPNQLTTRWFYDELGRIELEQRADGTETRTVRDYVSDTDTHAPTEAFYSITETISGSAPATVYFDYLGREIRKLSVGFDGTPIYQDTEYDDQGREYRKSLPYFAGDTAYWAVSHYDAVNRPIKKVFDTSNGTITTTIDYQGLTTTETNTLGQVKRTTKNALDKVALVEEEGGGKVAYEYDAVGNLRKTHQHDDANGQVVTTELWYDVRGQKIAMQDPDMGYWEYKHNAYGELIQQTDAESQTVKMFYDPLGRMVRREEPEGETVWTYDTAIYGVGKLHAVEQFDAQLTLLYRTEQSYDEFGREHAAVNAFEGKVFNTAVEYDEFGRVSKSWRPNAFQTETLYNEYGYVLAKRSPVGQVADYDPQHLASLYDEALDSAASALSQAEDYLQQYEFLIARAAQYDALALTAEDQEFAPGLTPPEVAEGYKTYVDAQGNLYLESGGGFVLIGIDLTVPVPLPGEHYQLTRNSDNQWVATEISASSWATISGALTETGNLGFVGDLNGDSVADLRITDQNGSANLVDAETADALQALAADIRAAADILNGQITDAVALAEQLAAVAGSVNDRIEQSSLWVDASQTEDLDAMLADPAYTVWWRASSRDAAGRLTSHRSGNGLVTIQDYDEATGQLKTIQTGFGHGQLIRLLDYEYDSLNNVLSRTDQIQNVSESFEYDDLNRLTLARTDGVASGIAYQAETAYVYDALGNMREKTDVGVYLYGNAARSVGNAGPHAIAQAANDPYIYDQNGSMVQGGGRTVTWSSFNKPTSFQKDDTVVQFHYGPDRARYKKTVGGVIGVDETTLYLGKGYERVEKSNGDVAHKYFVYAEGQLAAIHVEHEDANGAINDALDETRYLHRDALGSIDTITDGQGVIVERSGYSPFGQRRTGDWQTVGGLSLALYTNRGFTGHEHIDEVGLIHMNGRVYDPLLGRFLSADPYVQEPHNSQNYNRYAYTLNNPLKYNDPSGHFFGLFAAFVGWASTALAFELTWSAITFTIVQTVLEIVITAAISSFAISTTLALANGASLGQALETGFKSAILSAATAAMGFGLEGTLRYAGVGGVSRTFGQSIINGITSELNGGSFRSGFWSRFVHVADAPLNRVLPNKIARAAVLGGVQEELGGGKFANGAASAAFETMYRWEPPDPWGPMYGNDPAADELYVDSEYAQVERNNVRFGASIGGKLGIFSAKFDAGSISLDTISINTGNGTLDVSNAYTKQEFELAVFGFGVNVSRDSNNGGREWADWDWDFAPDWSTNDQGGIDLELGASLGVSGDLKIKNVISPAY